MITIENEGFSTFYEAKKDPPLSGCEFCSKFDCDHLVPEIRRKNLMSKKRAATTDFRNACNSEMRCKSLV